jgi:hypothetical protein
LADKLGAGDDSAEFRKLNLIFLLRPFKQKAKDADVKIKSPAQSIFKADAQKRADDAQILADAAKEEGEATSD